MVVLAETKERARDGGGPREETDALRAAIAAAIADLSELMAEADDTGADVLGFQVAMLEDEALSAEAFSEIALGAPAHRAWRAAIDREIADYEAADDAHFRARATDLKDIRDRILDALYGDDDADLIPPGSVVFATDLTPSRFLATDWVGGAIVLSGGSPSSHVAVLARGRGIPMVVGVERTPDGKPREAIVDGSKGLILIEPDAGDLDVFAALGRSAFDEAARIEAFRLEPARTADGIPVAIHINIADPVELDGLDPRSCDGIGLVRTELLFGGHGLPDEESQVAMYRRLVEWAKGRPVTVRTLDAGGDKPIAGLTDDAEIEPFPGFARCSPHPRARGPVPHAASRPGARRRPWRNRDHDPDGDRSGRAPRDPEASRYGNRRAREVRVPHRRPPLGMMVEVPAAALAIDLFDAEFFSIGSNDLVQYVTAAGRDIATVARLADPPILRC